MAKLEITRRWVGTSWKMNKRLAEALVYADALSDALAANPPLVTPFVLPPFTVLREVARALAHTPAIIGAQNMHWEESGAWTGEISASMLKDCGARLVEIGHSERRQHFGETDQIVGLKVAAAMEHGLVPLICVGETLAERDSGRVEDVLAEQVEGALRHIEASNATQELLFAYEPVWSIGERGVPASPDYADHQQLLIKIVARRCLGYAPAVLYGGSVSLQNCEELLVCPNIDGLFIGRSAWDPGGFAAILARCSDVISTRQ